MSKIFIKLKQNMLLDLFGKQTIISDRPQVVENTGLVNSHIAKNDIRLIASLKDTATDAEWVACRNAAASEEAAIKEFLAKYDVNAIEVFHDDLTAAAPVEEAVERAEPVKVENTPKKKKKA
jgi:hypothetical protein